MSASSDFDSSILDFFRDDPLTVTYIQYLSGTYDPSTSTYSTTTVETPCLAILFDLTRTMNGLSVKFGTDIVSGDKEMFLLPPEKLDKYADAIVVNTASDRVRVGLIEYKIEVMKEISAGSNTLVYNFMLRR